MRFWSDPEDVWVVVDVQVNDESNTIMIGAIDTVQESLQRDARGVRSLEYAISGRDIGKVFETTQLHVNIYEQDGAVPMIPLYDAVQQHIIGTPTEILKGLMNAWLGNNGVADRQWQIPSHLSGSLEAGQTAFDFIRLAFSATEGLSYEPSTLSPDAFYGRSLWDTLQEYQNGMLNEMFLEMRKETRKSREVEVPTLVLRERPFPTMLGGRRAWDSLPTYVLRPEDVQSRQLAKGSPESRFNYWLPTLMGLGSDGISSEALIQEASGSRRGKPGGAPIYNTDSIRKHGFRPYRMGTRYLAVEEQNNWAQIASSWIRKVHDWYVTAPSQLSGSLRASRLLPGLRIGNRLREIRKNGSSVIYYVEGISHSFSYPNAGVTSITLTRGEYEGEDLLRSYYGQLVTNDSHDTEQVDRLLRKYLKSPDSLVGQQADEIQNTVDDESQLEGRVQRGELQDSSLEQDAALDSVHASDLPDQNIDSELARNVGIQGSDQVQGSSTELTQHRLERGDLIQTNETLTDARNAEDARQAVEDTSTAQNAGGKIPSKRR